MSSKPASANTGHKAKVVNRRQFLATTARATCVMGLAGTGLTALARQTVPAAPQALRPPGALPEAEFLSACVRCGLCVNACPWDTLKLARWFDGAATGTPYFDARAVPCELCEDIPCAAQCPSGALDSQLEDINQSRMGLAVLIDQQNCLNFRGLRCDVCYRVCPLIDDAISLERQHNSRSGHHAEFIPKVNPDSCTGCGKCEHACVLEQPAIKVLPIALAMGKTASHDTYVDTESTTLDMLNGGFKP
ncbi:ferredoxin-type protein NapG [Shewanella submarina]|uniref:Ferredoxin-type protein NapG n=1 Tax=Shewanella submarina TaxID=2016376 RepID=A0ABV7GF69_9GAMM|nr:ferredoxin-type protein NapG [Shewanella submarina]MCL1035830.1 ferredoxin-type protein NapG [Shewanella submarina]